MRVPDHLGYMLRDARNIVVLTGAGISKESGLPTFREAQTGLWSRFRPEELATPDAFARNPALVWSWYTWRRALVSAAEPNAAHHALVRLARHTPAFTLITQNVDGLHRRAGHTDVIELHGDISRTRCSREGVIVDEYDETTGPPPRCPRCGANLRPDVVWFGEQLPAAALAAATDAAARCEVLLSVGTSGLVFPAASLVPLSLDAGADVIVINPEPQAQADGTRVHHVAAPAAEALPALVDAAWGPIESTPERIPERTSQAGDG